MTPRRRRARGMGTELGTELGMGTELGTVLDRLRGQVLDAWKRHGRMSAIGFWKHGYLAALKDVESAGQGIRRDGSGHCLAEEMTGDGY